MCDGNEKINRRICAAPKQHFELGKGMPNTIGCCPNTPSLGGKSKSSSAYCKDHHFLDSDIVDKHIIVTINVPDQAVSSRIVDVSKDVMKMQEENEDIGCKKKQKI